MKEFFEHAASIIAEASKSPLGISALVVLMISILAWSFFGESSELVKLGIFIPVIVFFFEIIRRSFLHSKEEIINKDHKPQLEELVLEPVSVTEQNQEPKQEPELESELDKIIYWYPSDNIHERYSLTNYEVDILETIRGKPDVIWTNYLILSKTLKKTGNHKKELTSALDNLIIQGYLSEHAAGKIEVMPLAVDYYRSAMQTNILQINEEDYWDGN